MSFHSRFDDTGVEVGGFGLDEAPLPNPSQRVIRESNRKGVCNR